MLNPSIALLAWPFVALWLFARLPFERAIIWSVLGSFLFLPSTFAIDLPLVPPLDKQSLPNLVLLLIVMAKAANGFRLLPNDWISKIFLGMLICGAVATVLTNSDPILIADRILPGLASYDALSSTVRQFLVIVPLLIGAQYLSSPEAHREILKALVAAGLFYSALMLFEVRMSPQLHTWVYGYFPHDFSQQIRWGGFRPVVFMRHGLWVAFFAMMVFIAALALWRDSKHATPENSKPKPLNAVPPPKRSFLQPTGVGYLYAAGYLGAVLFLCKSLGSLLYGMFLMPIVAFLKIRKQIWVAAILVLISLTYPILRGAHIVPTDMILEWAGSISAERQQSLETRVINEDRLLAHAEVRPYFGWGGWDRNRVYDAETGEDISITDGFWVIVIGVSGWTGYIAIFGLLGFAVLRIWLRMLRTGLVPSPVTSALCLLIGINMIEILPNSTLPPWTWLIAGALLGHVTQRVTAAPALTPAPKATATIPRTVL